MFFSFFVTNNIIKNYLTMQVRFSGSSAVERGVVSMLKDGIVTILHLKQLKSGEIVFIKTSDNGVSNAPKFLRALVLNLNENNSQGILLGNERFISEGALVFRSGKLFTLKCGLGLFGQVLDGLGENKFLQKKVIYESSSLVEQKATGIIDRKPVRIPLRTGIKSIDSLVPIGRGQRELIIGDRQTGKTSVALDSILNHVTLNNRFKFVSQPSTIFDLRNIVWFVYNAIGQKQSTVNQFKENLIKYNAFWYTAIVASTAAEPAPLQFLSPYTACTLGEFIRDIVGGHCTVIYDDLSKHAVAYRQMSLLLRRPPGREAFPGDVFYVHSRLLERAGSLTITPKKIRGTLTAFPVIETQAGDVSAYIPTNVISITDGQIFLETELFYRGIRPAVNVGLSVSRVGSAAQPGIMKKVAGSLKMELAQYREIEGFSKLGASLDEQTQRLLNRGENLIELLKQSLHQPLSTIAQVLSIYLGVGYNGSWLGDISKLESKQKSGFGLLSRMRIRSSWLEWFRVLSPDFSVSHISGFVNNFLSFVARLGIITLNLYEESETLLLTLFKIHPVVFFDDLLVSFFRESSIMTLANVAHTSFFSQSNFNLYFLRFGKNVEFKKKIVQKVESTKSYRVFLESCSLRFLLLRQLLRLNFLNSKNVQPLKKWCSKFGFANRCSIKFFAQLSKLDFADEFLLNITKSNLEMTNKFAYIAYCFNFFVLSLYSKKQLTDTFRVAFAPKVFALLHGVK